MYGYPGGNPFQIGGMPSTRQMNQWFGGGFTTVSPQQMALNQLAALGRGKQMFGGSRRRGLPMPFGDEDEQDDDKPKGISERIRGMLTGSKGAAIGGAAQAAGNVIGSYIASQPARAQQKEQERRNKLQEEEAMRMREMLMPIVQAQIERQRRIQEEEDRRRQSMGYGG